MKLLTLALMPLLWQAPPTRAADPTPRELHVAQCVAALDLHTQQLAQQVKAGQATLRPLLLDRLVAGAAFIGDSYLHGNRDEDRSRALADQARQALQQLPASELGARQTACATEGSRLFAAGNKLEQAIVRRLAKKRMERLLA